MRTKTGRTGLAILMTLVTGAALAEWKPTKTVEFVVTGGPGGGTDQFARTIQAAITKNKLMDANVVVVNKAGGSGAEGFVYGQGGGRRSAQARLRHVERVGAAAGGEAGVRGRPT